MKKKLFAGLAVGMVLLGMAGAASATTIFSDNFESDTAILNQYSFNNWTIASGSVDLIGGGSGWDWFTSTNGKYVDMDGSTGVAGKMVSKVVMDLLAGDYSLQFDLAGSQRGGVDTVRVNDGITPQQDYSLSSETPFQTFTQTFSLLSAATVSLSFEGLGGDNEGLLLDNIRLEKTDAAPVPEPATMLLLGTGLAGLIGARRQKKA